MKTKKHILFIIALAILVFISIVLLFFSITNTFRNSSVNTFDDVIDIPFMDAPSHTTYNIMIEFEGNDYVSYASVYNGTTYTYPKSYHNLDGTIKYMFDNNQEIKCVAWAYSSDNLEELENEYLAINSELKAKYGDSHYNPNGSSNQGNVWYLDGYNIILSAMTTDTQQALQYSYTFLDSEKNSISQ